MPPAAETSSAPIADIALSPRFGRGWRFALAVSGLGVALLAYAVLAPAMVGIGLWGANIPFVWGFDLINYSWWIGIANGANLVAALLVLRHNDLRTAVNRFAEAIALFAIVCAGIFPIFHLGRPWLFYWVFPYPATYQVWPQFRSTLTWDFWAISAYTIITVVFLYIGLIPDLAALRNRARSLRWKRIFGVFALGWRGSVRHWAYHQAAYRLTAALMLPLILVMQTTVSLEHAVMLVPGWHESSQPVYYIVSGLVSGLATVLLVAVMLRRFLGLERLIRDQDVQLIAKLLAASALLVAYAYAIWLFTALLADDHSRAATVTRIAGAYAAFFWGSVALSIAVPQLLWLPRMRGSATILVLAALAVAFGIWLDRFSLFVGGLERGYLRSNTPLYWPTVSEFLLLVGTFALFAALVLLFARYLPVMSMFEARHVERRRQVE
jgi:molybdopterin-containing oxidoreductase family membrane subunit